MERGIILGLPLFLVGHILLTIVFSGLSLTTGVTVESLLPTSIVFIGIIFYLVWFINYLDSSDIGLGKFKKPVIVYCIFIGTMFISSVLLWIVSGSLEFGIVIIGGLLFIISDSTIAVNEFHHKIRYREIKVMSTYYGAIFLLSLCVIVI